MLSRNEIINNLNKATDEGKIVWKVIVDRQFIKAEYEIEITKTKKVTFKIIYYVYHPRVTKLTIEYDIRKEYATITNPVADIGGKNGKTEARQLSQLLQKILSKNEIYKGIEIKIENDEIQVGDRVVVVKPRKERDVIVQLANGEKGTVINEMDDIHGEIFLLVEFDQKFMDKMVEPDFMGDEDSLTSDGRCWPFEPKYLRKIQDMGRHVISSQNEYVKSL